MERYRPGVLTVSFAFAELSKRRRWEPGVKIRFASCRLDTDTRRLFRGAVEVHLSPKAFELLKVLVENRDRAFSKAELLERVWPEVSVSDASLARAVNEIRQGIGDRARHARIVRTVHGYGYAFVGDVKGEDPASPGSAIGLSNCWLTLSNRTIPLADGEHVAGRDPESTIWLDSPKVSRHHARVVVDGGRATIEDLDSRNGTFIRGDRISGPVALSPRDEIRIGPFTLIFRVARHPLTTETEVESI